MLSLTRTMLPAIALVALTTTIQVRTAIAEDAHHPNGATTSQTQSAPTPAPAPQAQTTKPGTAANTPMIGQGMGSGAIVQPGAQQPGGPSGTIGSMMGQPSGQPDVQASMVGNMGGMTSMMRQMMMGQQGAMELPFEHVEGRIAFLKTELKIADAQLPKWNAFADALRASAKTHRGMFEQMSKDGVPATWPDRLAFQQKAMSTRLEALKTLEGAAKPLYGVLTTEQKATADKLLAGPMGMM